MKNIVNFLNPTMGLFKAGFTMVFFCILTCMPWQTAFASHGTCSNNPNLFSNVISYDLSSSYCELCGVGEVRIVITNPSRGDMENFTVTHDFLASGLEYVPGSTQGGSDPSISGTQLTWSSTELAALSLINGTNNHNPSSWNTAEIIFNVRSTSGNEENLVTAIRNVQATTNYTFCPATPDQTAGTNATGPVVLPIREPIPSINKRGRNVDASQGGYSNTAYGNINDDVIWRIRINNSGLADMQDLKFNDLMQNGNFQTNFACPSQSDALAIANNDGVDPGGTNCVAAGNTINNFLVDDPFGNPNNDEPTFFVDSPSGSRASIYLVGKITNSCNANTTNTLSNVEWGCEVNAPDGGINTTSTGISAGIATATLSSRAVTSGLNIQREITGVNGNGQPAGARGLVTITITNTSGGSVNNIHLRDVLPTEYVVDTTFDPQLNVFPSYGVYDGMVDNLVWTNPVLNTYSPASSINPLDYLANTAPEFDLLSNGSTSNETHPIHTDQINMLRHGDVAVVTFRVVLIPQPAYDPYDLAADLDIREENIGDSTDPDNSTTITNNLFVTFEQFCNPGATQQASSYPYTDNFPANPEDLDVDISGTELVFILTNDPTQPLPLQVSLTNRGGHDAEDYYAYVTFGATMEVSSFPASCALTSNPPPREVWEIPTDIPVDATVYECTGSAIGPGNTLNLNFEVIKSSNPVDIAADDLTFRADVVSEITLSDGTPLWFPVPDTSVIVNTANNYSLDGLRGRVIGFNLVKTQLGICTEVNLPPASPDEFIEIGEECSFNIRSGGWFGFQTPGFTYIAVQRITVTDELPDGQGYISSTDPTLTSDITILGISLTPQTSPPLNPLDEGWIDWSFNQLVPSQRILVRDQWFEVNITSRLLNDPIDSIVPPNLHAAISTNILNSTFQAVFDNSGTEEVFDLGQSTVGYPAQSVRRIDLTVTEPNILVTKEVCNETLYGSGTGCTNFTTLADDGDTQDSYIYRITLTNEATSSSVTRAPAYNLSSTDVLDPSDLVLIVPFASDGLDNDGDGLIDGADVNGEGSISDNIIDNATPAEITNSHTHSDALLQIDPGANVIFYYRVDPDDAVAPLQQLINTITTSYDSLSGANGNQTVVFPANSTSGGARVYASSPATATVQMLSLLTQPKTIINLANSTISGVQPQSVSVGEEIEYELLSSIPVANLRNFTIRDELPAGISCTEAPIVNLDALPYSAAGFVPGGQFTPTCTNSLVEWNFGDQELTTAPNSATRFDFYVRFIAQVDNTATTNDGDIISNGAPATNVSLSYVDESTTTITLDFGQYDIQITEPNIILTKSFETNITDAGDIITVTVTAENTGTATAYNLLVLDDLTGSNLTFLNTVSGTDPPDVIDITTLGINSPIFSWNVANPDFAITPGTTISFSFDISVDDTVQPLEILNNTLQASWTSLPAQSTALNSSSLIGIDGSATGMRIGTVPNSADAINDYENTATDSATVPAITMAKTDLNPAMNPEVGAHKNFQIEILLPEGISNNVVVNDNLNASGESYLLSNNADFDITYNFIGISSINGLAPSEAVLNAFPADNSSGTIAWDIGNVVTNTEDDTSGVPAITPTIQINYFARINNDATTNTGSSLQNSATVDYRHGETGITQTTAISTTPAITVTESLLTVGKAVALITPAPITGGDILEYTVTINNTGNATAYDVNIVDSLPVELELYGAFTPGANINAVAVPGFVSSPTGAPNGPLIWGRNNGDESLDIPAAGNLVLTYRVQIKASVSSNANFSNSVMVDWTSLDAISSYERTGDGCPTITAPNDYCAGPATANTITADTTTLVKAIIADTYTAPPSTALDATLRVNDIVTYRLELNLSEGTSPAIVVNDVLPTGLAFVDIVSINGDTTADYSPPASGAGSNFSYATITAAALPTVGQVGILTFTLGDVSNDAFGDATTDTLIIEYRAQVLNNVLSQVASTTLTNTATLLYEDSSGSIVVDPARLESSADLTLWQPIIAALTKTDRSARTSPLTVNVSTDIMNFRLEACNTTGLAPAYSVLISDVLPSQLDEGSISGPVNGPGQPDVTINGALATAGIGYVYTPAAGRGGTLSIVLSTPVNPGQCVQVDYDIGFYTDFGPNQTWNNSATIDEYWSLPASSGQDYTPVGPANFVMTNTGTIDPPTKTVSSPLSGEMTVSEEVVYLITIPGTIPNAALYDLVITDTLNSNLEYISATDISGNAFTITDNTVAPTGVSLSIDHIPAGQQAMIELRARLTNNTNANAGLTFTNTAAYSYAITSGGPTLPGGNATSTAVKIIEPLVTLSKAVSNLSNPGNPPNAGDLLRYTLSLPAAGGVAADNFADAFDLSITDTMSLGLTYQSGTATVDGAGNTINDPGMTGDGITIGQTLSWDLASANADIDISEGNTITITYDVLVLDGVLAGQTLANSASIQWTGLDGPNANERNGSNTPALNDYFTGPATTSQTTPDNNLVVKSRLNDTYGAADANVRIGDIVEYEIRLNLQEGTTPDVVVTDTLPQGLVFESIVSINSDTTAPYSASAPFTYSDLGAPTLLGDPVSGPSSVSWNIGEIINTGDNNASNDDLIIIYRARVMDNVHIQNATTLLSNNVNFSYTNSTGTTNLTDSNSVTLQQPLLTVNKSAAPSGGDAVLVSGELVNYTVNIINSGMAPAYDAVLTDIIPVGMRNGAATITMISTTLVTATTILPNLSPVYNSGSGIATWNFDNGVADAYNIPAGETLRIVYQVQADPDLGSDMTLSNQAQVQVYYSFDDEGTPTLGSITGTREIYGSSNIANSTLTTAGPNALDKQNTVTTASIGEAFSYRIIVPAIIQPTALSDVRIIDDLTLSAADLAFVSVSKIAGSQPWAPANTGTTTNLVIEDTTGGIDIPANEQIEIEVTVVLNDSATNVSGLNFNNLASYTYNRVNGDNSTQANGPGDTTANMSIVEPELTLEKSGTVQMRPNTPETFTLNIHNTGTGPAWDLTVVDLIPNPDPGGMCDIAPNNIIAQHYLADGITPVGAPLIAGVDYNVNFVTGTPSCNLTLTMQSATAALAADNRLIINYDVSLDNDTPANLTLTNIAGVTEWFSADTTGAGATGEIRTYSRTITDGTTTILDHEDALSVVSEQPIISLRKTVINVTTGQDPGSNASPGDILRYRIEARNVSPVELLDFSMVDEVDDLNSPALFVAGSLTIITAPASADTSNTNPTSGTNGTGILDIRNMALDAQGGPNDTVIIEFEVSLAPVISSGTVVLNQSQMIISNVTPLPSDDPNVNGIDDPNIIGDEDPTETLIASVPILQVLKTSTDLSGSSTELVAGDTLRYTISIKNMGDEDAINSLLQDQIPANTTYVANSTRLNGVAVTDPSAGISALESGLLINAPENTTPGYLRADTSATTSNVATIIFDVVINANVINGTIISNQGFVNAAGAGTSGVIPEQASDDPDTVVLNDPTLDIVGNLPLVDVQKTVALQVDNGTIGIVDPGDTLRYTITLSNSGAIPATGISLTDATPINTTYVANSVLLNGLPVNQPDAGISPLIAGIDVSSSDLTPPLPAPGNGVLSPGGSAEVTFDVQVNGGVPTGTVISNQGFVASAELPIEPTDADGIDANGDQATLIVVGNAQQLAITKEVAVVGGGPAEAGSELEYTVRVTNIGLIPATNVLITDNLDIPVAAQMTYIVSSATLNGSVTGINFAAPIISADYAAAYGDLLAGETATLRFRVLLDNSLTIGTNVSNTAQVDWNAPTQTAAATVAFDIGGVPGSVILNGELWHDSNFNDALDTGENLLTGWTVAIYRNGSLLDSVLSNSSGVFQINGLAPNDINGDQYELRYEAPGAGANTALLGLSSSVFTNGLHTISDIVVSSGNNVQDLNLPIEPNGVVYDAIVRTPIAGATLTLLQATSGTPLPANCFDDTAQQDQLTQSNGYYKFDLNFSQPECTPGSDFIISVTAPSGNYLGNISTYIPPQSSAATAAFSVPTCPGDAVPATANHCEVQAFDSAPAVSIPLRTPGTDYQLKLTLNNGLLPGHSQIFNNHIPLDPELDDDVAISKVSALINVTRGELVPYTITVNNSLPVPLVDVAIIDRIPAGFKYVKGSAQLNSTSLEPVIDGLQLRWDLPSIPANAQTTIRLILIVGSGVSEGKYINRANIISTLIADTISQEATATVRVVPDPTFDCSDIIGKVFDDKNINGLQDSGEPGIGAVRLATARGLLVTTDKHGRFHISCAAVPDELRGSNFILKLDDRTLPGGYRVTTENPRVETLTRGKLVKFNFGATIHHVLTLDLGDGVFEPDSSEMRPQWLPRLSLLVEQLGKGPSILRITYLADVEKQSLVKKRLKAFKKLLNEHWKPISTYPLTVETEIFWRLGGPVKKGGLQ